MKNAVVLGFCWTSWNEIIFVTDQGIEFYQVTRALPLPDLGCVLKCFNRRATFLKIVFYNFSW